MSVHKLKDGRFIVQYRDKTKKSGYARKYFGRGLDAEQKAKAFDESLGLRPYGRQSSESNSPLFVDLAQIYINAKANEISKDQVEKIGQLLNAVILPRIGNMDAGRLTATDLDAYVSDRRQKVKATTVRHDLAYIQAVYNFAVERRVILFNPVAGYKAPKSDAEIISPPTADEVRAMVRVAPSHLKRALTLAYFTGLRFGRELFQLQWSSFDLVALTVVVKAARKGGPRSRTIPLADEFIAILRQWRREDGHENGYLIRYMGKPITSVKSSFNTAKRRAKITRRLRPYDFRHAFASVLLNQGEDLKSVSEMLGHANTATTLQVYQHTSDAAKRRIVNKIPALGTTNKVINVVPQKRPQLRRVK